MEDIIQCLCDNTALELKSLEIESTTATERLIARSTLLEKYIAIIC